MLCLALTIGLFAGGRLYSPRLHLSLLDEGPQLLARLGAAIGIVTVFLVAGDQQPREFLILASIGAVLHLLLRAAAFRVLLFARRRGYVGHRAVILGGGVVAEQLASTLREHPEYGLRVVGYVDEPTHAAGRGGRPLAGLDPAARADPRPSRRQPAHHRLREREERTSSTSSGARRWPRQIFIVPRMFEMDVRPSRTTSAPTRSCGFPGGRSAARHGASSARSTSCWPVRHRAAVAGAARLRSPSGSRAGPG